ncbi:MAG: hypothetical protein AB7Q29_05350 [Vicinamibacterales bacterium]
MFLLLVATCGCGWGPPPLAHAESSPRALASAVLDAYEHGDREALRRLALSESEFRDHVWPQLPASKPERNLPFSYVWGDLRQKSEAYLSQMLGARTTRHHTLLDVRFAGETTQYDDFVVHRRTVLTVEDEDGVREEIRLYGSVLEKDGAFKVFSFVTD